MSVRTLALVLVVLAGLGAGAVVVWSYNSALVRAETAERELAAVRELAARYKRQATLNSQTQARGDTQRLVEQAADRAVAEAFAELNAVDLEAPDATERLFDAYTRRRAGGVRERPGTDPGPEPNGDGSASVARSGKPPAITHP